MIDRRAQTAMIIVLKRHEAERLEYASIRLSHWREDFSHAMHRARLRLECQFDERTGSQSMRQLQQTASHGNGLEFGFCAPAIF